MNLLSEILKEHSKRNTVKLAKKTASSPPLFGELMRLYFGKDQLVAQRAAWVMSTAVMSDFSLIQPYLSKLITHLNKKGLHDAVVRNGLKILETVPLPNRLFGKAANLCFPLLANPQSAIAIRCFAMTTLSNIAQKEPDIKKELLLVIEDSLPFAGAGFRSRARRTMKELDRL